MAVAGSRLAVPERDFARGACAAAARGGPALGNRALGRLAAEGRSPAALRTLSPQLGNRALARLALQRAKCDPPASARDRPGVTREVDTTALAPRVALVGDKAWELTNFDVDKAYVKEEHEAYIKAVVVPELKQLIEDKGAYVAVAGEASSTWTFAHNWDLSRRRAECVHAIVRRELLAAGVIDTGRLLKPMQVGEVLSNLRSGDDVENDDDRRVTILAVESDPEQVCPEGARTRGSKQFKIKVACDSPLSVAINIGDVSDPGLPTWRAFKWFASPAATHCEFRAKSSGSAGYGARKDFHLALRDPDDPNAPSDLQGEAELNAGLARLFAADGKFDVKLPGTWSPKGCKVPGGEVPGWLLPAGPVFCGEVPQPARGKACDDDAATCTEADKLAPATRFGAMIERVGFDIPLARLRKRLPAAARYLLDKLAPEAGIALVHIGTLDGPEPRRMRTFLFAGFAGDAAGLDGQVGFDSEATSTTPLRLATEDPDGWASDSDFDSDVIPWSWPPSLPSPAKLEIGGGNTNVEKLHVGGMTFEFHGVQCSGGGSRTIYGWFGGVHGVKCWDIGPLTSFEPEPDCEADDCPADTQLAGHDAFTIKVGRAALADLPLAGQALADRYGCEVVAARVNIGNEGDDPIHREFLFVGRRKGCRFDVDKGSRSESFMFDRQLSLDDPENPLDNSDFSGIAVLDDAGELTVRPLSVSTGYSFTLPGAFDATCTGAKGAEGLMIPLDDVRCGKVPEPQHDTTPDPDPHASCRDYTAMHPLVGREIAKFKRGEYDHIVAAIPSGVHGAAIYYSRPLKELAWTLGPLRPAIFVGQNHMGVPVITFVEMEVVTYTSRRGVPLVTVRFVSDACSFDADGNPVFVQPLHCEESLPFKGQLAPLEQLWTPEDPAPEPDPDDVRTA